MSEQSLTDQQSVDLGIIEKFAKLKVKGPLSIRLVASDQVGMATAARADMVFLVVEPRKCSKGFLRREVEDVERALPFAGVLVVDPRAN